MTTETRYIAKRKRKAFYQGLLYYMFRIFHIQNNKIVFWTFEGGGGYGCSPRYIADEILRRKKDNGLNYQLVWLMKDTAKEFPPGIKKVKDTALNRAFHLTTARFWIGNSRLFYGTKKRRGQYYIQTWHATICIKPIGKYRGNLFPKIAEIVSEYDSGLIDYVLSGSDWCDHMYRKGLLYNGEIIKTGTPRCDVLFNQRDEKYKLLREQYDIPQDGKIILYAPTFRGGSQNKNRSISTDETTVDLKKVIAALEKRFGGQWYVFLRLHPQLAALGMGCAAEEVSERMRDVTQRADMNELIAGVDAFLTDYSSAVFEAALINIPGFLYADDLEEYVTDRGDLFFDMYKLPFQVALNNSELIENILQFDDIKYRNELKKFWEEVGIFEDGKASGRVVDLMTKVCELGDR